MAIEVRVPTLGESVSEATVATWFKRPGDAVAADEMLCELETDKVTVEVPAPAAGQLSEIVAPEGTTVGVNALLAQISQGARTAPTQSPQQPAPQAAPKAEEGKMTDVMVPTLGESVTEATVSTWFKKVGDAVAVDEMLCELETDKVSVEVPSPVAGVLTEILAPEGTTVDAKARLAVVAEGAAAAATAGAAATAAPAAAAAPAPAARADVEDAPAAKKAMAEAGLSATEVTGTGKDGRIMKEDVARAVAAPAVGQPQRALLRGAPLPRGDGDRRPPGVQIRDRQIQRLRRTDEPAQMRVDQPGPPVAHQQRLEHPVAADGGGVVGAQQRRIRVVHDAVEGDQYCHG